MTICRQASLFCYDGRIFGFHAFRSSFIQDENLTDKNTQNETSYKNQIINDCEIFWNFINAYIDKFPLLRSNFIKSIIIKIFSSCSHIYLINKDFNKINQIKNYFDKLSNNIDITDNHNDCGLMIFDIEGQDVHAGGSGCGCSASVFCSYIMKQLMANRLKNILFVATGALMSPISSQQGESIPSIAHLLNIVRN